MPKASPTNENGRIFDETKQITNSFSYAKQGLFLAFCGRTMRIHGLATVSVIAANLWLGVTRTEWLITLLLVGAVLSLEMINTAIEELANVVRDTNKLDYQATKYPRDVAAGAVLVMAMIAALCALLIYGPYLWVGSQYIVIQ